MPQDPMASRKAFRRAADLMSRHLERRGSPISHPHALDALSAACDVADWNTMSAMLKSREGAETHPQAGRAGTARAVQSYPPFEGSVDGSSWDAFLEWAERRPGLEHPTLSIKAGQPVTCRMDGAIRRVSTGEVPPDGIMDIKARMMAARSYGGPTRIWNYVSKDARADGSRSRAVCYLLGPGGSEDDIDVEVLRDRPPSPGELEVDPAIVEAFHVQGGGINLFSGPSRSGRTTLMHALLRQHLERPGVGEKVVEVCNPVEYRYAPGDVPDSIVMQGVKTNLDDALNHSPSIIVLQMLQDSRDLSACVRAASAGCLVLATMEANSAMDALFRLSAIAGGDALARSAIGMVNLVTHQILVPGRRGGREVIREHIRDADFTDMLRMSCFQQRRIAGVPDDWGAHRRAAALVEAGLVDRSALPPTIRRHVKQAV